MLWALVVRQSAMSPAVPLQLSCMDEAEFSRDFKRMRCTRVPSRWPRSARVAASCAVRGEVHPLSGKQGRAACSRPSPGERAERCRRSDTRRQTFMQTLGYMIAEPILFCCFLRILYFCAKINSCLFLPKASPPHLCLKAVPLMGLLQTIRGLSLFGARCVTFL